MSTVSDAKHPGDNTNAAIQEKLTVFLWQMGRSQYFYTFWLIG